MPRPSPTARWPKCGALSMKIMCMHTQSHTGMYVMHVRTYVGMYVCMYVCVYVYICICICTYVCMYVCMYVYTHTRVYVYIYIHTYMHTYIHAYIHTYIHKFARLALGNNWSDLMRTHTHTNTCTLPTCSFEAVAGSFVAEGRQKSCDFGGGSLCLLASVRMLRSRY